MQTHSRSSRLNATHANSERGVALVIVLAVLLLMSGMLVAFMSSVSSERVAQRAAAASFEAKQAYESAVNLVISQIRSATSGSDGETSWASQPGAIRTFDAHSDLKVYKLYSSDSMQMAQSIYDPTKPEESGYDPKDPKITLEGFVNLNEPILVLHPGSSDAVDPHYPIINPHARLSATNGEPSAFGKGRVEGFDGAVQPHWSGAKDALTQRPVADLPMRVRWLYHLQNGIVAAPDSSGRIPGASKDNPPIARVAFWTDDETAKLNVNTAGEYTFWDTPHASVPQESGNVSSSDGVPKPGMTSLYLAASQPAAQEYQRFPGHPATTCLSPAMRWLAPTMSDVDFKEAIYRLSPRLMGGQGSSVAATRNTDMDTDYRIPKRDRMFASIDEYWFRPDRSSLTGAGFYSVFRPTGSPKADTPFTNLTPDAIEQLRFFLTTDNRAPELNLFGKPRISMWPVHEVDDPDPLKSRRTAFDDLIAFCSTVAKKTYYFTRRNPWSPTDDYVSASGGRNKAIVEKYLKGLFQKKIPGAGGAFKDRFSAELPESMGYTEADRLLLSIYDYVRSTNLVDTGRKDFTSTNNGFPLAYTPNYESSNPPDYSGSRKPNLGSGQVVPTVIYSNSGGTSTPLIKGFGRFVTLSEVALLFYYDSDTTVSLPGDDTIPGDVKRENNDPTGKILNYLPIRCVLLPEMYAVAPNYPALSEAYAYRVTETKADRQADPLRVSLEDGSQTKPLSIAPSDFSQPSVNYVEVDGNRTGDGRFFMPTRGITGHFLYDAAAPKTQGSRKAKVFSKPNSTDYSKFPFYSKRIWLPGKQNAGQSTWTLPGHFKLDGGSLTFELMALQSPGTNIMPPANTAQILQRIHVTFPAAVMPVPKSGQPSFPRRISNNANGGGAPKLPSINPQSGNRWIPYDNNDPYDSIRSMEASGVARGDYRHIAGLGVVPSRYFAPSGPANGAGSYSDRNKRAVHNLHCGWGRRYDPAGPIGKMTDGATPRTDKIPDVPIVASIAQNLGISRTTDGAPGDYDRGISKHMDGPFIGRPDEGNVRFKLSDNPSGGGHLPYYRGGGGYEEVGQTFFSPNRLVSSPVILGSLPTGIFSGRPWETLLFSPPASNNHSGERSPRDHFLLDLFCMPVVEPYAISEPLSSAGRVNLNHRLAPFGYVKVNGRSYIERSTALHGVLKSMWQMTIPNFMGNSAHSEEPLKASGTVRQEVDRFGTIERVINPRLDSKKYFKSPTEICEMDLLLLGSSQSGSSFTNPANRQAFWKGHDQTGDNMRERPYAQIYPRLTTKSNVFTVHAWAQRIAKNASAKAEDWNRFDEKTDRILGEYRGSSTIERYIDPNEPSLKNYDAVEDPGAPGLDGFYRFRILGHRRFTAR